MTIAIIAEGFYGLWLTVQWFNRRGNSDENKKDKKVGAFNVSLSEAIYVMLLTLSSTIYIVWGQMDGVSSPKFLLYLLPVAIASNAIWLLVRVIVDAIFRRN